MSSFSPTAEGFRIIFRRMSLPLAEIAWRWTFATAAWVLGITFLLGYMGSLPVTSADRLLLGTQQPVLISRALQRIFHGSAFRFTEAAIVLLIGLAIAWIVLASLGRTATLAALLEEFGIESGPSRRTSGRMLRSLSALNFLRVAVFLAAKVGGVGAILIASSFWASTKVSVGDASRLWFAVLVVVGITWAILNWLLSTAAVFVAIEQKGALNGIASCARFCVEHPGWVLVAGIWFGLPHLGAFITAFGAVFTVLSSVGSWRMGPALALEFVIIAAYCVVADFLYMGRLAAYVAMVRGPEAALWSEASPTDPAGGSSSVDRSEAQSVDRDELILSDVPLLAT
jgi:hypothetical protein